MAIYNEKSYTLPDRFTMDKDQGVFCFMEPPNHPYYFLQSIYNHLGNETPKNHPNYYFSPKDLFVDNVEEVKEYWEKLPYNHERVGYWEKMIYSYFKSSYSPDGKERNVDKAIFGESAGLPENHLGYLYIKKYYPEAKPKLDYIDNDPKFYGVGYGVGNWWETLEQRPTPENCKPRSMGRHPTINPELCGWCGMGKDPVNKG